MKKIFSFFLTILMVFAYSDISAQSTEPVRYTLKDSVNIRNKDKMRQWSYENGLSNFAPQKRNNWSIGVSFGPNIVTGDVAPEFWNFGGGINVRKALGHVFSIRGQFLYGKAEGLNWRKGGGTVNNHAINGVNNAAANYVGLGGKQDNHFYHNFQTKYYDLSLQGVININNINFKKKDPKVAVYLFGGPGIVFSKTMVDALNGEGSIYAEFADPLIATSGDVTLKDKGAIRDELDALLDGDYETAAQNYNHKPKVGKNDYTADMAFTVGAGIQFKLGRRVDLSIEHKANMSSNDLWDGQKWQKNGVLSSNFDGLHQTMVGLNFRIGKTEDALWWRNPLDQPLDKVRSLNVKVDKYTRDSDGDGVVDALDQEPNTMKGVRVDNHGIALDSDGDGVPDFKDFEPFSPKRAEVDANGKALDGDNDGVPDIFDLEPQTKSGAHVDAKGRTIEMPEPTAKPNNNGSVGVGGLGAFAGELLNINFDYNKDKIKAEFYDELASVAQFMKQNPNTKVKATGHADSRNRNKLNMNLSERRVQNAINFIVDNFGIAKGRFVMDHKGSNEPLFRDLPNNRDPRFEKFHYLNRRVEFSVVR